jgi:serine protease
MKYAAALLLAFAICATAVGQTVENNGLAGRSRSPAAVDQLIVKWKSQAAASSATTDTGRAAKLASSTGLGVRHKLSISADTEVLQLSAPAQAAELHSILSTLSADPNVEYAVPDERRYAHAIPNDPLVVEQWYFLGAQPSATRAEQAWDVTAGSDSTVVAVLDTGVRFEHPDLGVATQGGKLLAGFDFVSNVAMANDGNGRDADASDPGDWVSAQDATQPPFNGGDCIPSGRTSVDSSWHGTRVASLIGALTNNATGMAGGNWSTLLLPVRVLGKCGGNDSDIIAGMRWAAGLSVIGVPANPTPAKIVNLSLGGEGACSAAYQSAIDDVTARGVLVVVSVGNDSGSVSAPANCDGALGVSALRHAGTKVGYSNLGPGSGIGAPGGNCVNTTPGAPCDFSILVATNTGTTTPDSSSYTSPTTANVGSSFSAPLVAGAAALMHAVNDHLTPAQYIELLQSSARVFPTSSPNTSTQCHVPASATDTQFECVCTTQTCGAGMLDTQAAVLAAQRPYAIVLASSTITPGTSLAADGRGSFASNNRTIASYQWSVLKVTGATPTITNASTSQAVVDVAANSQFTLRLTITDDQGSSDSADVAIATPTAPTTPPPTPAMNLPTRTGGGGGGAMDPVLLALLAMIYFARQLLGRLAAGASTRR